MFCLHTSPFVTASCLQSPLPQAIKYLTSERTLRDTKTYPITGELPHLLAEHHSFLFAFEDFFFVKLSTAPQNNKQTNKKHFHRPLLQQGKKTKNRSTTPLLFLSLHIPTPYSSGSTTIFFFLRCYSIWSSSHCSSFLGLHERRSGPLQFLFPHLLVVFPCVVLLHDEDGIA